MDDGWIIDRWMDVGVERWKMSLALPRLSWRETEGSSLFVGFM
jgi:hypothetical protein